MFASTLVTFSVAAAVLFSCIDQSPAISGNGSSLLQGNVHFVHDQVQMTDDNGASSGSESLPNSSVRSCL